MQYGQKTLFENTSLNLIRENATGLWGPMDLKNYLAANHQREELPSKGLVSIPKNLSPGLLQVISVTKTSKSVMSCSNPRLWSAFSEKEQLLAENSDDEESGNRLAHLEVIIAEEDGYAAEAQVEES